MGSSLDTLLTREVPAGDTARARALAAARAELARMPQARNWRTEALRVVAAPVLLTLLVTGVLLALDRTSVSVLLDRAPLLLLLWTTSAVCAWGALAPRGRGLQQGALGMALVGATALVFTRGPAHGVTTLPEWVCTASHVGVALLPGVVALAALRSAAFQPARALLAGVSVGTVGAFLGELACSLGPTHVLHYHLPAWAFAAVATLVASRFLPPRSFAP
ncbi:DUF1109 domain-containing protein [Melittangium boletus]|uniref:Carotenogenesis protein CarR n=1 Tax=Melittangium boletus DSM 14713 TaxID=1294270 RepID=A0A250ILY6_9BACT|nr:DUF1109 domain-containing protein [Melittangium boletus]ATB32759.1 carotenogenesis protein CarR [Melittangium boletus DSM 14713]